MDKALFMLFDMAITLLLIIMIIFIAIFAVHVNQLNTFEDQAQAVISRSGGFTQQAQDKLNQQADSYYQAGGVTKGSGSTMFQVVPYDYDSNDKAETENVDTAYNKGNKPDAKKVQQYESATYGSPIKYKVTANIPLIPNVGKNGTTLIFDLSPYSNDVSNQNGEVQEVNSEVREGSTSFNS